MTTASRIGVSNGTMISLGVWALKANRRLDNVLNADRRGVRGRLEARADPAARWGTVTTVDMEVSLFRRVGSDAAAGETQGDVGERPRAGARRDDAGPEVTDRIPDPP